MSSRATVLIARRSIRARIGRLIVSVSVTTPATKPTPMATARNVST